MADIHCIYASTATVPVTPDDLSRILATSRRNNELVGITGMLLHVDGSFFQVLEGPEDAVDATYARIAGDARHNQVTRIIREPIARRTFGDWTMGFSEMQPQLLDSLVGGNDFFGSGTCLAALDGGRAKKLLTAFSQGRWRARIAGAERALTA